MLKIAIAALVALVIVAFIPSLIATCMLLAKSIRSMNQKRSRRAMFNYR